MATSVAPTQNGVALDQFNAALRASPGWQDFIQRAGYRLDGSPIRLTGDQRKALKRQLEGLGVQFPKGMEIDPAGNVNQDQGLSAAWANPIVKIAVISGAALATMGAAGFGPLAGVMGQGGSAAGAGGASAASTAATVGGAAAGASGVSRWLTPLLSYGLPAATGLIGARMQASADKDAAQLQTDYLNRALDAEKEERDYRRAFDEEARGYNRQQYADYLGRLKPYGDAGNAAVGRASSLLTTSRYRPELAASPQGRMVQMRAPSGEVSDVPETLIDHYEQRGARRV